MGYFKKANTGQQEVLLVTKSQKEKIKKDYGLSEGEVNMMFELRIKRDKSSFSKFIERIVY